MSHIRNVRFVFIDVDWYLALTFCRVIYEIKDEHTDKYIRRPLLGVIRIPHIFVRKFFSVEINFKSQPLRKRGGERERGRERERERERDRQTDRQTHWQTDRQIERETERDREWKEQLF